MAAKVIARAEAKAVAEAESGAGQGSPPSTPLPSSPREAFLETSPIETPAILKERQELMARECREAEERAALEAKWEAELEQAKTPEKLRVDREDAAEVEASAEAAAIEAERKEEALRHKAELEAAAEAKALAEAKAAEEAAAAELERIHAEEAKKKEEVDPPSPLPLARSHPDSQTRP